jgi:hypothetical protein
MNLYSLLQGQHFFFFGMDVKPDRLCGIVVRVPGYRSRNPDSIPALQYFLRVVGLERGPLSLVSTIQELLVRKSSGSGLEN